MGPCMGEEKVVIIDSSSGYGNEGLEGNIDVK
jgi:hypothetical protein